MNLVVARVGLFDTGKAVNLGLIVKLANRDRTMLFGVGDQEVRALLHFGFAPIVADFRASLKSRSCPCGPPFGEHPRRDGFRLGLPQGSDELGQFLNVEGHARARGADAQLS